MDTDLDDYPEDVGIQTRSMTQAMEDDTPPIQPDIEQDNIQSRRQVTDPAQEDTAPPPEGNGQAEYTPSLDEAPVLSPEGVSLT